MRNQRVRERHWRGAWMFTIVALAGTSALAQDHADRIIETRIAGFRDMGAAFKNMSDEMKARQPNVARLLASARVIDGYRTHIPDWFPIGSEAPAKQPKGLLAWIGNWFSPHEASISPSAFESHAKPEIWSKPAQFRQAYEQFATAAQATVRICGQGDVAAMQAQFHKLREACEGCHDTFREELD